MSTKEERTAHFDHRVLETTFYGLAVMDTKIVKNQINLPAGILDQALEKLDEGLGIHRPVIEHESCFVLIGNRRNKFVYRLSSKASVGKIPAHQVHNFLKVNNG